jgi:DNA-binding YbaB/EbfC family protein
MDRQAAAPGDVNTIAGRGHRDLHSGAAQEVNGCHRLDLLKSVRKDHEEGGGRHQGIEYPECAKLTDIFSKTPRYFSLLAQCSPFMAGVGKLLKQAQKMQRSIETLQAELEAREIEVAAGGGAVKVKVSIAGKFLSLSLDPEFLKEDAKIVSETLLAAIQDASKQAKELNDSEMQKVTSAFQMPGIF